MYLLVLLIKGNKREMVRVCLLLCDTPAPSVQTRTRGPRLRAFEAFRGDVPSLASVTDFDAVLISGSKFGVNDDEKWIGQAEDFVRAAKEAGVRIVGAWVPLVAKAFGGRVERNMNPLAYKPERNPNGWEAGHTVMRVTDEGKRFFGDNNKDSAAFYSMHKDVVTSMIHNQAILTIQAHPEFNPEIVREIVKLRRENGIFQPDYADELNAILDKNLPDDSLWFAQQIVKFILAK
ncbi:hypothetical protein BCR33DRAFT_850554 [Rhizoclosmatium globosum]|uniref:Class I glutamine amidotransferase-like protein n=1 Tax=Rhizoclosmatium globosum TaxID=329046 RepID=A0A1Y2CBR0_9FUNG|nr:hypothetical protein BCR33DRAFT_850554 [Rhizoclosmatium globosum]|eukprot:ORY44462.1 hypothetical protein BCR33DRAFT_850554 [Rhizoclosmatium globosum]